MTRLKQLIIQIHRRSLWQVLLIYVGASWAVLEAVDHVVERYFLPEWVSAAAVILLLIGLPIVMATAFVREEPWHEPAEATSGGGSSGGESDTEPDPGEAGPRSPSGGEGPLPGSVVRLLTWPRAILGGVLAFLGLALISAFIVVRGMPRVAEARGAAGPAFEERAWVVVADFEAPPDEGDVAAAAHTALTLDLQQSQYVNVYGREQVIPVLGRMGLPDTTELDRRLALEIAEREGLAAVLAPEVSRLGSDYVFGTRVFESGSRRELIAVRTAARANRLLEGVEALSREVRGRLGEASEQIGRSKPLPEVTTRSLEALKKYARAVEALEVRDDWREAIAVGSEAVELDSSFAMAERLLAASHFNAGQHGKAVQHITRAYDLRQRLTDRERLHVEAFHAFLTDEPQRAAETWGRLLSQYPDDSRAANNLGVVSMTHGDYERAYRSYRKALELSPYNSIPHNNVIDAAVAAGRLESADTLLTMARQRGHALAAGRGELTLAIAREQLARVDALCDSLLSVVDGSVLAEYRMTCGSMDVAWGRLRRGSERLEAATRYYAGEGLYFWMQTSLAGLLHAEESRGRSDAAGSWVREVLARFPADSLAEPDRHDIRTRLIVHSALLGRDDLVDRIASAYPAAPTERSNWRIDYSQAVARSARSLAGGELRGAFEELRAGLETRYELVYWVPEVALIRGLAFEGLGEPDSAIAHLEAAITPWTAIYYQVASRVMWPFVLRRLAELEESRGNTEAALRHYRRWLELRSDPDPSLRGEVAAVRRAVARLAGAETS